MSDAEQVESEVMGGSGLEQLAVKGAGTLIIFGIFEVFLGMAAIVMPLVFSVAFGAMIGVLFIIAGILQLAACRHRTTGVISGYIIFSVLYILLGVLLLINPMSVTTFITLLLGIFFIIGGIFRFLEAVSTKFSGGAKAIIFFNALVTFILGWMIVAHWPGDAEWVLGILVGINLLFNGWTALLAGLALKRNTTA